jgi:hypothetical protein
MNLGLSLGLPFSRLGGDTTPGGAADAWRLEYGLFGWLLEDGSSFWLMES